MRVAWGALFCLVFLFSADSVRSQDRAELRALNAQVQKLSREGKFADAEIIAREYVDRARNLRSDQSAHYASAIGWLGAIYLSQGKYTEAEPLLARSAAIYEQALGPDHADVGKSLSVLAGLYRDQGRYEMAEPLYKRSISILEKVFGTEHADLAPALNNLAMLYVYQSHYRQAEPYFKRSLAIHEKALGSNDPNVGTVSNNLAELYRTQARYGEAEPYYQRTIVIFEKALGPEHHLVATSLNNLALLYQAQGRYEEAEPLYQRSLNIREKTLGREHLDVSISLNNLAELYRAQGRYGEAEAYYQRSIAIFEKTFGPGHPLVGTALNGLALVYQDQKRFEEAEPLYQRSLTIAERVLGSDHPDVGMSFNNLAWLYQAQGRYKEATPLYQLGLTIREKALGSNHPDVAQSLNNLATLYLKQRDWPHALDYARLSAGVILRRAQLGAELAGQYLTGREKTEAASFQLSTLVKAAYRLAADAPDAHRTQGAGSKLLSESFIAAQWAAESDTAAALTRMSARQAKGNGALAKLVRERQDLVAEWQNRDRVRSAALSDVTQRRNKDAEAANLDKLTAIEALIAEIDKRLTKNFPDYAALSNPEPLSVEDAQKALLDQEVLVLFLDTAELDPVPEETFIWAITKTEMRWVRSALGSNSLARRIHALRCGLDAEEWEGIERPARCAQALAMNRKPLENEPLPFHLGIAHELYAGLFGQIEDLIKDKQLLIIPSGPLTSLPFHPLVTERPKEDRPKDYSGYRDVAWLGTRQQITILPSVASLRALRRDARSSKALKAYLGYGNPFLSGHSGCTIASTPDSCDSAAKLSGRAERGLRSTGHANLDQAFSRGAGREAVLSAVRQLCPLPDTSFELSCVAQSLGVGAGELRIGAEATEADIKARSDLDDYRVLHFATHGLLAGDTQMLARRQGEPALVLTPPRAPQDSDDDGLLTASEVALLKLDANWVILSACNTAAGSKLGAEALSGLARAFFYAGARALLVSQWPVYSDAAVALTTRAFAELNEHPEMGRAEAVRRAMAALITSKAYEDNLHPAIWAPFIVVGEGGPAH